MIVRTLTSMLVAAAVFCGSQASAETRRLPLDLAKVNASAPAKKADVKAMTAMAYAPEAHSGGLQAPTKKRAVLIPGTLWVSFIKSLKPTFEQAGFQVEDSLTCGSFVIISFACQLDGAAVVVAHSAGAGDAARTKGAIAFLVEGFGGAECWAKKCVVVNSGIPMIGVTGENVRHVDCREYDICQPWIIGHVTGSAVSPGLERLIREEVQGL